MSCDVVDLDKVSNNHMLGRLMAEQLMHALQIRRWNVVELRLGKDISITGAVASSAQANFNANSVVGGLMEKDIKSSVTKISVVSDK